MGNGVSTLYEFGSFRLDSSRRLLVREGQHLALPPKTFDLLLLLVESRGRVFTKKELMSTLWPDTFVEDANLSFQISALRKVLGKDGTEWIETLPRYGYRFSGDVLEIDSGVHSESAVQARFEPPAPQPAPPTNIGSRAILYWVPTALAVAVAAYFAVTHLREVRPPERAVRFLISPPAQVMTPDTVSFGISPNGERLVFVGVGADGRRQLWVRALDSLGVNVLAGTELAYGAFWSPDSRSLAFFAGGKLKRIDLQGGSAQTICDVPVARGTGTWSRDGVMLFETIDQPQIYRVEASGGAPKPVRELDATNQETRHSAPQFLPDGRHFIYFVQSEKPENTGIYVASLDSKASKRLVNTTANAAYARRWDGASYLLFASGMNLTGQAFDLAKLELVGTPFVVAQRPLIALGGGQARAVISASENGVLAYRTQIETGSTDLVWLDRQGKRLGKVDETADYSNPELSPDEKKLVVSRMDPQTRTRDLWLFDFASGASSRFTFDPADETNSVWSPDGTRVAFNAVHNSVVDIYEKAIAGSSEPKVLLHSGENKYIHGWSPDGKLLLFRIGPITWALPRQGDGKIMGPYALENPRISPNGRWVAYTSNQSGRSEVYVQNFPPAEGKWQISTSGGTEPSWRADGKELFYMSADKLFAMQVKTDSAVFEPGVAKTLFSVGLEATVRRTRYQAAANGRRFLVNLPIEASSPITIAINWAAPAAR